MLEGLDFDRTDRSISEGTDVFSCAPERKELIVYQFAAALDLNSYGFSASILLTLCFALLRFGHGHEENQPGNQQN